MVDGNDRLVLHQQRAKGPTATSAWYNGVASMSLNKTVFYQKGAAVSLVAVSSVRSLLQLRGGTSERPRR